MRREIATCEGYDQRLHALRVFFHADYDGGTLAIQSSELNGAAWFVDPPSTERLLAGTQRLLDGRNTE